MVISSSFAFGGLCMGLEKKLSHPVYHRVLGRQARYRRASKFLGLTARLLARNRDEQFL